MKFTITSHAKKQIKKLPKAYQIVVAQKIRKLVMIPVIGEEKLSGYKNFYKVRVGVYRIIFIKFPSEIEVVLVGHRREVYLLLKKLVG
ncbi:MAG: type II toxin-antitoxin system RelE/ParE family toxin [Patescibacteria group bacterium]